jgi:hypothetical protein
MTRTTYGRVLYDGLGHPVGILPAIAAALPLIKGAAAALIPKAMSRVASVVRRVPAPRPAVPVPAPIAPVAVRPVTIQPPPPVVIQAPASPPMWPPHAMFTMPSFVRPMMSPYVVPASGLYPMFRPVRRRARRVARGPA